MENKKITFGIFGLSRGNNLIGSIRNAGGEVTAICDYRPAAVAACQTEWFEGRKVDAFDNFDEFIKADFDVVLLANYFCEHAEYAIRSMKAGKHVLSETLSNITMAEGVALCRTKEETGKIYALLENYPFFKCNQEIKRLYSEGKLGDLVYAEGEYCHAGNASGYSSLAPGERHWRNWIPRTYYSTHALAPLMYMTDSMPTKVTAMASFHPEIAKGTAMHSGDAAAIILCHTDNNAVLRVIGAAHIPSHGGRYRVCGTRGSAEPNGNKMHLIYNSWCKPEGVEYADFEYPLTWHDEYLGWLAEKSGHEGADFFVMYDFIKALEEGREPYFNVYRATAASSVAILAWRSILNDNKCYDIPDFSKEEERKKYENDNISPFPDENYRVDIPSSSQPYSPTEEDLNSARAYWKNADFLLR